MYFNYKCEKLIVKMNKFEDELYSVCNQKAEFCGQCMLYSNI